MQLKKQIRKQSRATRIRTAKKALAYNPEDTAAQELLDEMLYKQKRSNVTFETLDPYEY